VPGDIPRGQNLNSTHRPLALLLLLSPGVATYTDKLLKFRNNRWEDILSDEVNVARGVASLFAGRSVACVDRTVSSGFMGAWEETEGTQGCGSQERPPGSCPLTQ
jgi:hypothetical protein